MTSFIGSSNNSLLSKQNNATRHSPGNLSGSATASATRELVDPDDARGASGAAGNSSVDSTLESSAALPVQNQGQADNPKVEIFPRGPFAEALRLEEDCMFRTEEECNLPCMWDFAARRSRLGTAQRCVLDRDFVFMDTMATLHSSTHETGSHRHAILSEARGSVR